MHILKFFACSIVVCGLTMADASEWLRGKVTDEKGVAIEGAVLSLGNTPQTDTTDASGMYDFGVITSARHQLKYRTAQQVTFGKNTVQFTVTQRTRAKIGVFNLNGKLVKNILDAVIAPALHSISVSGKELASSTYLLKIKIGAEQITQQMYVCEAGTIHFGATDNQAVATKSPASAKVLADIDNLKCTAYEYESKDTAITSYKMEVNLKMVFVDVKPPVVTIIKDDTALVKLGDFSTFRMYFEPGNWFVSVKDNVTDSANLIPIAPTNTSIDTSLPGLHWLKYSWQDEASNRGDGYRLLSLYNDKATDNVAPVITLKGSDTVKVTKGDNYTDEGVTVKDAVDTLLDFSEFIAITLNPPLAIVEGNNIYKTGDFTGTVVQTYRVMDTHKNIGVKTRIIQVK